MNILLVKPCSVVRKNLSHWLKGYFGPPLTITVTMTLPLALEKLRRRHFDLVMVKAGRGSAASRALLAFTQAIAGQSKVIVYASHNVAMVRANPYQQGVDGFISMWEIPSSLVLCIKRVMRGYIYQSPLFI